MQQLYSLANKQLFYECESCLVLIFQLIPSFAIESLGSCSSTVPVLVPRFLLLDSRVSVQGSQGVISILLILVLVRFHVSFILAPNQVEPKDLVLKLKLSGT